VKISDLMVLLTICLFMVGCSVTTAYQNTVELPKGTTTETASKIVSTIWQKGFYEKIKMKFPDVDPSQYKPFLGYKKSLSKDTLVIIFGVKYKGKLDKAKNIVEEERKITQGAVDYYFKQFGH